MSAKAPGPHCKAPSACKAHPKSTHCRSCEAAARWQIPGHREAVGAKVSAAVARNGRPPFKDELRARRAVLLAGAFGLTKAGEMMGGLDPKKISLWRRRLEKLEGKTYPRLSSPPPKLSIEKAREIRALAAAGEKYEYLAHVYDVAPSTIGRIVRGVIYPQLGDDAEAAA